MDVSEQLAQMHLENIKWRERSMTEKDEQKSKTQGSGEKERFSSDEEVKKRRHRRDTRSVYFVSEPGLPGDSKKKGEK